MKKQLLSITAIALLISACSSSGHANSRNNPVASLFDSSSSISNKEYSTISISSEKDGLPVYDKIDVDLTTMSSTMVYSEVFNMLDKPSNYVDKIVKVKGPFKPLESNEPDYCYPAIIVQDATACCSNGLEFLLYGIPRCSMSGGNGYPLYGEEATIVGRFERYLEGTLVYVHLVDAIWLKN